MLVNVFVLVLASGKLIDRCVETVLTAINTQGSQLLHIKDLKSEELFLVDSGAEESIVKPTASEKNVLTSNLSLVTVNGSPVKTYGNRIMTWSFDNKRMYRWIFIIADVNYNIYSLPQRFALKVPMFFQGKITNSATEVKNAITLKRLKIET